ncbi:hypothetical protein HJB86_14575 [Rhizobium sp. NZLR3b]|uniref:hypothetical protein n=1 Tax=Rhizobium sp. NZLR3b TaxID=2731101 RepID=UPI001C82CE45|nr:hypothetical protein [Rhizobium sp. NZLR3b]MBX5190132.1 hypothetical protein [Rhizobium sp. NZLR3b]
MMKFTNTQKGPRGLNAISGPVLVDPGQTVEAEVYAREQPHIEAAGWFSVEGSYTGNPGTSSGPAPKAVAPDSASELEDLKKQLAARDAELAKLKAGGTSEREDLKKQADELGLEYPGNISNAKLKEMIDAKLAS